jgi:oxygen-independent coproporphyrinogen-3 oxidase
VSFALYIHWPFCRAKCPYCDFNSHVREAVDEAAWREALLAELDHFAAETRGRALASVFFGGGTPSLMSPATVGALLDRAASRWRLADDVEITLEANPTSVEAGKFAGFRSAGVNRVSLGVQALDDAALKALGRRHDAAEAVRAVELAARHFERWSFDLIYARPGQTADAWERELDRALPLVGDHLSAYQLTIEPGTAFATAHARGELILPDEEDAAALYELTQAKLEAAGMPAYEVSNHARPGGACRHNLVYWRHQDYVGIGPGAHGRLTQGGTTVATRQLRAPETWLESVAREGHGTQERIALSSRERAEERLMMGLRLAEGVAREAVAEVIDARRAADLVEGGFLAADPGRLRATPAGRQRLNAVLGALLAGA